MGNNLTKVLFDLESWTTKSRPASIFIAATPRSSYAAPRTEDSRDMLGVFYELFLKFSPC